MPKNNCPFQARWLEDEPFKYWVRKKMALLQHAIIAVNYCNYISVANMEKAFLTSHMKGKST